MIEITNEDNMKLMARYPDNHFDLAIVDPPYGIGISGQKEKKKGKKSDRKYHAEKGWDKDIPSEEYFKELFRVSNNQIIWGANYFVKFLEDSRKGWIVWDKGQHGLTMSDCELAYSSFHKPTRVFLQNRVILLQEGSTIHPTQKPVKLYEWLLMNYAKKGQKILDTHLGSGSIAVAVHNCNEREQMNLSLTACELDKEYYEASLKRLNNHTQQKTIFSI
jgi:site-specific DNA-methyltransferase (adenine-specific)